MGKKAEWKWSDRQVKAFHALKEALLAEPVLQQPDFKLPFELHTDASAYGVGALLVQRNEAGKQYVVRYMSKKLTDEFISLADCVIITTDHSKYDFENIAKHANLIIDTRNATKSVQNAEVKIIRLGSGNPAN